MNLMTLQSFELEMLASRVVAEGLTSMDTPILKFKQIVRRSWEYWFSHLELDKEFILPVEFLSRCERNLAEFKNKELEALRDKKQKAKFEAASVQEAYEKLDSAARDLHSARKELEAANRRISELDEEKRGLRAACTIHCAELNRVKLLCSRTGILFVGFNESDIQQVVGVCENRKLGHRVLCDASKARDLELTLAKGLTALVIYNPKHVLGKVVESFSKSSPELMTTFVAEQQVASLGLRLHRFLQTVNIV